MSPAYVLEPTYEALRRQLLAGAWSPGYRLEAARLAEDLSVSITPVRDSLNRLTGERLVSSSPGDGFYVPYMSEMELRGLLRWHHLLLENALRTSREPITAPARGADCGGLVERAVHLFEAIAASAADNELDWALSNAAARLGPYRRGESAIIGNVEAELDEIERLAAGTSQQPIFKVIESYHLRRRGFAAELVHMAGSYR